MVAPIQKLVHLSSKIFGSLTPDKITKDHLSPLIRTINDIKIEDVQFDPSEVEEQDAQSRLSNRRGAPVTYMHLFQDKSFSMSVFIVKSGGVLPLHDHPKMHGLLKVIYGTLKIISYTEVNKQVFPDDMLTTHPQTRSFCRNIKTVRRNNDLIVTDEDDCCILTPTDGNIHEIHSETQMAAFLDILAPPYANDATCHYYQELPSSTSTDTTRWLLEIPQPNSYWCNTISYKGPSLDNLNI